MLSDFHECFVHPYRQQLRKTDIIVHELAAIMSWITSSILNNDCNQIRYG